MIRQCEAQCYIGTHGLIETCVLPAGHVGDHMTSDGWIFSATMLAGDDPALKFFDRYYLPLGLAVVLFLIFALWSGWQK